MADDDDDPRMMHATVTLTLASHTPACLPASSRHIQSLINNHVDDDIVVSIEYLKESFASSPSSGRQSYMVMNPTLTIHSIYYMHRGKTNKVQRREFSRLWVIAHNLAVETGRWNGRGRGSLEVAERLCPCGAVRDELHVLESCPLTRGIRTTYYNFAAWNQGEAHFPIEETVYKVLLLCFN